MAASIAASGTVIHLRHGEVYCATLLVRHYTFGQCAQMGIQPTPVINLAQGAIYALAVSVGASGAVYRLHKLDLATGKPQAGSPVVIAATVQVRKSPNRTSGAQCSWSQGAKAYSPILIAATVSS
jgi:hypothetical protein